MIIDAHFSDSLLIVKAVFILEVDQKSLKLLSDPSFGSGLFDPLAEFPFAFGMIEEFGVFFFASFLFF